MSHDRKNRFGAEFDAAIIRIPVDGSAPAFLDGSPVTPEQQPLIHSTPPDTRPAPSPPSFDLTPRAQAGEAGSGSAKARTSDQARAAVLARWAKQRRQRRTDQ